MTTPKNLIWTVMMSAIFLLSCGLTKKKCDSCTGTGKVPCVTCSGTGKNKCTWCDIEGKKSCSSCFGSKNEYRYDYGYDYSQGGKYHYYLGYFPCQKCNQTGKVKCTNISCDKGKVDCTWCFGSGEKRCLVCSGTGEVGK